MNVDWALFKIQKEYLIRLASQAEWHQEDTDVLDGIINFMDAYQDENEPKEESWLN